MEEDEGPSHAPPPQPGVAPSSWQGRQQPGQVGSGGEQPGDPQEGPEAGQAGEGEEQPPRSEAARHAELMEALFGLQQGEQEAGAAAGGASSGEVRAEARREAGGVGELQEGQDGAEEERALRGALTEEEAAALRQQLDERLQVGGPHVPGSPK